MTPLSAREMSFVDLMAKSDEHARRGFGLLQKRPDLDRFFDALEARGLFQPSLNPAPVPAEPEGSVRIPHWAAADYLVACASVAGERGDQALAARVMAIVRVVTAFRDHDDNPRDNYLTFGRFAEILGLVPTTTVTVADAQMVAVWIRTRFGTDTLLHALDEGPIPRLLQSEMAEDWHKAVEILRPCLAVTWRPAKGLSEGQQEPTTVVDAYWLKELVSHHAADYGRRVGREAADLFRVGLREMFSSGTHAKWSYLVRPAIEDHSQNHSWEHPENCFVEGFRDLMLSWHDVDSGGAGEYVATLLTDDSEIIRRIGIFLLNAHWSTLGELYLPALTPTFFSSGHLHELYGLMRQHFGEFSVQQKTGTLEAIRSIPAPSDGDDADTRLQRQQRRWLSAVSIDGDGPIFEWAAALKASADVGVPEHPDFHSYIETRWGPGPSPFQVAEVVALAEQGLLASELNSFVPDEASWRGPTTEALEQALRQSVIAAPATLAKGLPTLVTVQTRYQCAVLDGFKRVWESDPQQKLTLNWQQTWESLIAFSRALLERDPDATLDDWLASVMADLLRSGTTDDSHAYPPTLLPSAWAIIVSLTRRARAVDRPDDDPMQQAINSPKGRSLEAAFSHALRACRLGDLARTEHSAEWADCRPLFEQELARIESGNYEFSTLAGAYLANLDYIDADWVQHNLKSLFPEDRPPNLECAVAGLAFSPVTRRTYRMLRDAGVLDAALLLEAHGRETRKKLIERVVVGYLWAEEDLDSPRMTALFRADGGGDLEAASWFLWTVRGEALAPDQLSRLISFWARSVEWSRAQPAPASTLLSSLSMLAWALPDAQGEHAALLAAVAPHVNAHHGAHEFLKQLRRLVDSSAHEVAEVLSSLITHYQPVYDFKGEMKALIRRLADLGERAAALDFCERLREVPGMRELFAELTAQ